MTPKFIEHIHLNIQKDLTPKVDDIGNIVNSAVNQAAIYRAERIDEALCKQIRDIAASNGISSVYILDKKNIVTALKKQIPDKPIIHGIREGREINTVSYTCPMCNEHIGRDRYCKHCGQALDWSDTE